MNEKKTTYFRIHNEERKFGGQLAAQRAQEQFHLDRVRYDDAKQVFDVGTRHSENVVNRATVN